MSTTDQTKEAKILTREEKKRQTRQAFYNAVLDLCMMGQGFSSISLRQVTREVGVVPTAFYRHFDDMEELGKLAKNAPLNAKSPKAFSCFLRPLMLSHVIGSSSLLNVLGVRRRFAVPSVNK